MDVVMNALNPLQTEDYSLSFDPEQAVVRCAGFLRLDGVTQYQPLMDLLLAAIEVSPVLVLNLEELEFLNSSGISMLSMFVVKIRERGDVQLTLRGSVKILWQTKSLRNLQRLMPALNLELV
jgi:hypothetical protein